MENRDKPNDRFATTLVLPRDELAVRRHRKQAAASALSIRQLHRLLAASELRKRAERDE